MRTAILIQVFVLFTTRVLALGVANIEEIVTANTIDLLERCYSSLVEKAVVSSKIYDDIILKYKNKSYRFGSKTAPIIYKNTERIELKQELLYLEEELIGKLREDDGITLIRIGEPIRTIVKGGCYYDDLLYEDWYKEKEMKYIYVQNKMYIISNVLGSIGAITQVLKIDPDGNVTKLRG